MKRALAVVGFSMLIALTVFCKVNNSNVVSVAIIVTLTFLFVSLVIKPLRRNKTVPVSMLSVFMALCLLLVSNAQNVRISEKYSDSALTVSGSLIPLPYKNNSQSYYIIKTNTVNGEKERLNIRISSSSPIDLEPTDIITTKINTFLLGEQSDEFLDYYKSKGVLVGGYIIDTDYQITKGFDSGILSKVLLIRYKLFNEISSVLPNDYGAVVCGLVLGEKSNLSNKITNAFQICGVSHLFAVSGLHITIWSALIYRSIRKWGISNKKASILSILFCIFFMLLTGCNPPVVRAGFMMILIYLSNVISREADSINSIGFSLIVMLVQNPYCALSVSLWLSLLATLGIILTYNKINAYTFKPFANIENKRIKHLISYAISLIAVCVSVNIFTLPVYFFKLKNVSFVLLLSNLLMVLLGKLCMEISGLGSIFMLLKLKFIGTPLLLIGGVIAKILVKCALFLSSFRYVLIPVTSPILIAVFSISILILILTFSIYRKNSKIKKTVALVLSLVFILSGTYIYADSLSNPTITIGNTGNGISCVVKYKGFCSVIMGENNNYYAETIICDIMKDNATSKIDSLMLFTDESNARKIISTYEIDEILTENSNLKRNIFYQGAVREIEHSIKNYDSLTIATEKNFCQIIFENKLIAICFDNSILPNDYCCDILVCTNENIESVNFDNFQKVIICCEEVPEVKIQGALYSCETNYISFKIKNNEII